MTFVNYSENAEKIEIYKRTIKVKYYGNDCVFEYAKKNATINRYNGNMVLKTPFENRVIDISSAGILDYVN